MMLEDLTTDGIVKLILVHRQSRWFTLINYLQTYRAYRTIAAHDTFYACSSVEEASSTYALRHYHFHPKKEAAQRLLRH